MDLRTLPITLLKPAPYNPRKSLKPGTDKFKRLERSLSEFELVQPIVWNEQTGHIVGGHQRVEVLRHQGTTIVEVVVVSLPLEREKALNVTLNNREVGSDWDIDKLVPLLEELVELPEFDETLTGFNETDLNQILLQPVAELLPEAEPTDATVRTHVRVEFCVLPDRWEELRTEFDQLIQQFDLEVHIRLPQ